MSTSETTKTDNIGSGHRANQPAQRPALTSFDYFLYTVTVLSWSASWYALKLQVGIVPVQVSLFWRYLLAAAIMVVWVTIAGSRMRYPLAVHIRFLTLGGLLFCLNFALFYYASAYLASGLLSVVFSLAAIFNILIAVAFSSLRPGKNVWIGALLGFVGIGMMFWPVIAGQKLDGGAMLGLGLCIIGTLSFCIGNLISANLQKMKIPVISASCWGMGYGAALSGLAALVRGEPFIVDWNATYLGSLAFLAIVSSVIAFAAYLTLLGRIGSDRAGYTTVMFPVLALIISSVLEDFNLGMLALAGLVLVMAGNFFVLGSGRKVGNRPSKTGILPDSSA